MPEPSAKKVRDGKRFREILSILRKHQFSQGLTPEKLRAIFEDLGPTFVKFGQILSMRADILPQEYCTALESLRTDVAPMPADTVRHIITERCGRPWEEIFSVIDPDPLGSASIAQVHEARLTDGKRVVVKVQRPGIKATAERDIILMKRAAGLMKYTPIGNALDFGRVLDEMWKALQEELDFSMEARNLEEFRAYNADVAYASCPEVYEEFSNSGILVMEYIGGYQIDDSKGLTEAGYDLDEIAVKLINNYIKQITVDRFFHADPHPGNIRVRDGKIIWIDLGMMGRLSKREADLYTGIIKSLYNNDTLALTDTLLSLCECKTAPDRLGIGAEVDAIVSRYKSMPMADINIGQMVMEVVEILNRYGVSVPASLTMLGRSLLVVQGMLAGVSPDTNVMGIVADYVAASAAGKSAAGEKAKSVVRQLLLSGDKLTMLPEQASDLIRKAGTGQLTVNVRNFSTESEYAGRYALVSILILCLLDCALILGAALCCLAPLPRFLGLPWLGTVFLAGAIVLSVLLIIKIKKHK